MRKIIIVACLTVIVGGFTVTNGFIPSQNPYNTEGENPTMCHKTDSITAASDTTKKACPASQKAKCEKKCPHKKENEQK